MKKISRPVLSIVIILIIITVLGGLKRNVLARVLVTKVVEHAIGAPVSIGHFNINSSERTVTMKDFVVYDPKGFPREKLLNAEEIRITYEKPLIRAGSLYLSHVVVDLQQIVVIKRADGKLNVDALKGVSEGGDVVSTGKSPGNKAAGRRVYVENFTLSADRVVYKDYTAGKEPAIQVFDVNIQNRSYKDIPGVQTLFLFMVKEAMANTAIKGAAIYGLTAFTTVGFWPAGVAVVFLGSDSAEGVFQAPYEKVFDACVSALEVSGTVTGKDASAGSVQASSKGRSIGVKLTKSSDGVHVTVSARKLMLPNPSYARIILYEISQKI